MKIRIELDEKLKEDEVLIRTSRLTDEIAEIQKTIVQTVNNFQKFTFYKGTTEYFLELRDILFFETDEEGICAHTVDDIYQTKSISSMNGKICCRAFLCGCQNPPF